LYIENYFSIVCYIIEGKLRKIIDFESLTFHKIIENFNSTKHFFFFFFFGDFYITLLFCALKSMKLPFRRLVGIAIQLVFYDFF